MYYMYSTLQEKSYKSGSKTFLRRNAPSGVCLTRRCLKTVLLSIMCRATMFCGYWITRILRFAHKAAHRFGPI